MSKIIKTKGFALLYAILLSGAVLSVGLILMNIITKQLLFSSLNRESEVTYYYLANSGRECLAQAIIKADRGGFVYLDEDSFDYVPVSGNVTINCFGQNVTLAKQSGDSYLAEEVSLSGGKVSLEVQVNRNCLNGGSCDNNDGFEEVIDKYVYVAIATGFSPSANQDRLVKRSAVYVQK